MTFAFSLAEEWVREVSLSVAEDFWRAIPERRLRTKAVHLITKVEVDNDPSLASAYGSGLVRLFREAQPLPFEQPLAEDARPIIQALFGRLKVTPLSLWDRPSGALSRYVLRVMRYCYKDRYELAK